ncbi:hypothetical protein FHX74_002216 [Friedmanniella endophytica]|uniref:Uncharacterized protein n=1 Tax=Microlunatus kandeliicorticis TaxID=1759536 RepID=A0A7W3ISV1_9ACTN|nr:hypothetical protein [Microlunatus kandeliicorticis]MBA8794597.1 hypothetical protein [Microlunatus kandeliicorticis]
MTQSQPTQAEPIQTKPTQTGTAETVPAAVPGSVVTSPARLRLRERVRQLQRPAAPAVEHVGGRPTVLRWSGLAAH